MPELELAPDETSATLKLADGERVASALALVFLARRGVRYGHLPSALASLQDLVGPAAVVVAQAEPPVAPTEGWLEMPQGNVGFDCRPKLDARRRLVFPELPAPTLVRPGDVIALRHAPRPGRCGRGVTGKPIGAEPPAPDDLVVQAGAGAVLQEDRVLAMVEGNPLRLGSSVQVVPETRIAGDLEGLAADLEVTGNLLVMGDVQGPRRLSASGDVTVLGNVNFASISAGGRIVVHGGVVHKAELTARDAVVARFIEGSTVSDTPCVVVRQDVAHCQIQRVAELYVGGALIGGQTQAFERVVAREVGGSEAPATVVAVVPAPLPLDPRPALIKERQELDGTLAQVRIRLEEAQRVVTRHGSGPKYREALEVQKQLAALYQSLLARDEELERRYQEAGVTLAAPAPTAEVLAELHPGVELLLGMARLRVETPCLACTLLEAPGLVQIVPRAMAG